jgi:uncharacterized cupin superfamily protein
MPQESFLGRQPWDEVSDALKLRSRMFARTREQSLSASLQELAPGSPGHRLHMHYGIEEMFFVLSGTPTLRTGTGNNAWVPAVSCTARRDATDCIRNPDFPAPEQGDPGIIARFELPREEPT